MSDRRFRVGPRKPVKKKPKEKLHNGKPMSHWRAEAAKLVMDALVRAAFNLDVRAKAAELARERLVHLAQALDPVLYEETLGVRERCQAGMVRAVSAFMLTPSERKKMTCKHKRYLDSVDVKRRPIRTCSSCGKRLPRKAA